MLRKFKLNGNNYFFHVLFYSRGSDVVHADLGEITVESVYQAVGPNAEYQFFMNDYREGRRSQRDLVLPKQACADSLAPFSAWFAGQHKHCNAQAIEVNCYPRQSNLNNNDDGVF